MKWLLKPATSGKITTLAEVFRKPFTIFFDKSL